MVVIVILAFDLMLVSQQMPDRDFQVRVENPAYAAGSGPVVCLDEAHANFHTLDDRFAPYGDLIRRDGYVPRASRAKFSQSSLRECGILVVANAQSGSAGSDGTASSARSAFSPAEIDAASQWIRAGRSLLLIADHMPMAAAAADLAAAFGVTFTDGFAVESSAFQTVRAETPEEAERDPGFAKPTIFRTADGSLRPHAIIRGRSPKESVTAIRTFVGQAFRAPVIAEPLLVFPPPFVALTPDRPWHFGPETRRISVGGWLQGAVLRIDSGRAAFFGEAAMFSAQLRGPERTSMGMNAPGAEQNSQFVLNVMHWLSGVL
jgi:hypothetical protein